jgi:osmotically inducible protein OsmC
MLSRFLTNVCVQYEVSATSTGGRDGIILSTPTDGTAPLKLKFAVPKAIGGRGDEGHNPEQLFAAGYSGEFESLVL